MGKYKNMTRMLGWLGVLPTMARMPGLIPTSRHTCIRTGLFGTDGERLPRGGVTDAMDPGDPRSTGGGEECVFSLVDARLCAFGELVSGDPRNRPGGLCCMW